MPWKRQYQEIIVMDGVPFLHRNLTFGKMWYCLT